jgi:hypothetical protein
VPRSGNLLRVAAAHRGITDEQRSELLALIARELGETPKGRLATEIVKNLPRVEDSALGRDPDSIERPLG